MITIKRLVGCAVAVALLAARLAACSSGDGAEAAAETDPPASTVPTADLCEGLVQDAAPRPMTPVPQPERGASFVDPDFGTTIRRVTDAVAQFGAAVAKPAYSTVPAWNADESLLIVYVTQPSIGHALLDGRTYEFIRMLDIAPADIEQFYWSSTDPDLLYYPAGTRLIGYHVSTGAKDVLYDAPGEIDFGDDPMYSSWDNQLFGIRLADGGQLVRPAQHASQQIADQPQGVVQPQVSPSGTRVVIGRELYDAQLARLRPMTLDTVEHASMTLLPNGEDLWVAVQYSLASGNGILAENLQTGEIKRLVDERTWGYPPGGVHVSGHAFKRPGWVAVSIQGDETSHLLSETVLEQELLLIDAVSGVVCRVGRHRSSRADYWSEPHVNISPSGTRLLFGSNWGGGATVDTYVVELPSYRRE